MDNYIYILGANSEIGRELIKLKLEQNLNLCLLTTNSSKLETYIEELQLNTKSKIKIIDYDLSNSEETVSTLLRMSNEFIPKRIFVMVGYLGDRTGNNSDDEVKISKVLSISNALGVPTAVLFSWVRKDEV